jgi:assimilatory nitrate reductase catalytic subunit
MVAFPFASCVPFSATRALDEGQDPGRTGVLFRAAGHDAPGADVVQQLESLLGLSGPDVLRYTDRRKGHSRAIRLRRDGAVSKLEAFLLAGDTRAEAWIRTLLQEELPVQDYGRMLLVPGAVPAAQVPSRGRQICSCLNVSEASIREHLAQPRGFGPEQRLAQLQASLGCGTQCGSCVPELKRLVRTSAPDVMAA